VLEIFRGMYFSQSHHRHKTLVLLTWKRFCKGVGNHVFRWYIGNLNYFLFNHLGNEALSTMDMLCPSMIFRVPSSGRNLPTLPGTSPRGGYEILDHSSHGALPDTGKGTPRGETVHAHHDGRPPNVGRVASKGRGGSNQAIHPGDREAMG